MKEGSSGMVRGFAVVTGLVILASPLGNADPLRFTSGSVSGTNVTLNLAGVTNLVCEVQRLDFPSDTWVAQGTLTLSSTNGTGIFNSSVTNGLGYFRAKATNDSYFSTNAFGSIVGTVPSGFWLVGNPFPSLTVSQMFPSPVGGSTVYYTLADQSVPSTTWDDLDEAWVPDDHSLGNGEGFIIHSATTNAFPFQVWGIFATNSFSRTLWTNWSINCSPLYHKLAGGAGTQIDEFNTNRLGGYSLLPVTSASNPQAYVDRNDAGVANQYLVYTLTSTNQWQHANTNIVVPILIGEGFWFKNLSGSNQVWTVSLPIW